MRKLMIGAALAALISNTGIAGEVSKSQLPTMKPLDLSISIESDLYYNSTTENITSETGVVVNYESFSFGITPTTTSDDFKMTDLELALQYDWKLTDKISVSPYAELHYDDDFDAGDKILGLKTSIKLY